MVRLWKLHREVFLDTWYRRQCLGAVSRVIRRKKSFPEIPIVVAFEVLCRLCFESAQDHRLGSPEMARVPLGVVCIVGGRRRSSPVRYFGGTGFLQSFAKLPTRKVSNILVRLGTNFPLDGLSQQKGGSSPLLQTQTYVPIQIAPTPSTLTQLSNSAGIVSSSETSRDDTTHIAQSVVFHKTHVDQGNIVLVTRVKSEIDIALPWLPWKLCWFLVKGRL